MSIRGFKPINIKAPQIIESSVFEQAPYVWNSGTTYALGAYTSVVGSLGEILIYKSLQAGNLNKPPASEPLWWVYSSSTSELYSTNVYYQIGHRVIHAPSHKVYQNVVPNSIGRPFNMADTPPWLPIGKSNLTLPATYAGGTTYSMPQRAGWKSVFPTCLRHST